MGRFTWLQLAGLFVAVVVGSVWLMGPPAIQTIRGIASVNAESALNVSALHSKCMQKNQDACVTLVKLQRKFHLSADHIRFYRVQACKAGFKMYCM